MIPQALRDHFRHHPLHMAACAAACVVVIVGAVFSAPVLAGVGAFACGAMMVGMVWMMARHGHHH